MSATYSIQRERLANRQPACPKLCLCLILLLATALLATGCTPDSNGGVPPEETAYPSHTESERMDADTGVTVLKFGHSQTEDHPFHLAALYLGELVAQRTEGRIYIDVYSDNSLGDEITLLEGIAAGYADMGSIATGNMSAVVEDFAVFELPYLFSSYEHVDAALRDGEAGAYLEAAAREEGVIILSWSESGFRHFLNAQKEIHVPADLEGLRVRIPEWSIFMEVCSSFGAKVIATPFSEVYTASQHGVIDAQEGPLMAFVTRSMYDTMTYLTLDGHIYAGDCKVISAKALESLSPGDREILKQAVYEAGEYQRELIRGSESAYLEQLVSHGVSVVTEVDKAVWQEACSFVYEKYADQLNLELVDLIQQTAPQ